MNPSPLSLPSLVILSALGFLSPWAVVAIDFREEVRPILNKKCFKCHTGPRAKAGLRMDSNDDFAKRIGGDEPVIIPGDPARSLLVIKAGLPQTNGDAMPPPASRGNEPMTAVELNTVKQWIALGAKLGEPGTAEAPATTPDAPAEPGNPGNPGNPGAAEMRTAMHSWTNSTGATLEAAFVGLNGETVTLRKEDGSQFDYPLANLNPESQELARKLATE